MENIQSPSNHNLTETVAQQQARSNNSLFVAIIISVLLTAVITGSAVYFWQRSGNEKAISSLEQKVDALEKQISTIKKVRTTPLPTSLPELSPTSTQLPEAKETKTYIDPDGRYKFSYPSDWKVLNKMPEKFRAKPSYVEGGSLEEWLKGKMMAEICRGPILQNLSDPNQLIAFEVVDAKGDGGFCWSTGYFMDDDKWKVTTRYTYPIGSNNSYEPGWKGDYFKMERAAESNEFIAFISLVNYETFQFKGEDVLQKIVSSFQFLD